MSSRPSRLEAVLEDPVEGSRELFAPYRPDVELVVEAVVQGGDVVRAHRGQAASESLRAAADQLRDLTGGDLPVLDDARTAADVLAAVAVWLEHRAELLAELAGGS